MRYTLIIAHTINDPVVHDLTFKFRFNLSLREFLTCIMFNIHIPNSA